MPRGTRSLTVEPVGHGSANGLDTKDSVSDDEQDFSIPEEIEEDSDFEETLSRLRTVTPVITSGQADPFSEYASILPQRSDIGYYWLTLADAQKIRAGLDSQFALVTKSFKIFAKIPSHMFQGDGLIYRDGTMVDPVTKTTKSASVLAFYHKSVVDRENRALLEEFYPKDKEEVHETNGGVLKQTVTTRY